MPDGTKLAEFIAWCQKNITGDEKGQAQIFLDRLFHAFGQPGSLDVGGKPEFRIRKFIVFSGDSIRNAAILKMNADQIAEARKRVAAFVPHKPQQSDLPEPAWVQKIKLVGMSGTPDHRLAFINNKTFEKGDQFAVKIGEKLVTVHCLEIRESSVVISIEGLDGTRELMMPH
jgi:hypothetical protein